MSVGYTFLQLSPVEAEFKLTIIRSRAQLEDRQFRYVRLLSVDSSSIHSHEWSCNLTEESKLIQLDTLVSLNYEYNNQLYDCLIFASTIINLTNVDSSRVNSLNYRLDFDKGFRMSYALDYSLLITDGAALFDYETRRLLGIGYNESCDDYEDICLLNYFRPSNMTKIVRLVPYTFDPNQIEFQVSSFSGGPVFLCILFAILFDFTYHYHCHYEPIERNELIGLVSPDDRNVFQMEERNAENQRNNPPDVQEGLIVPEAANVLQPMNHPRQPKRQLVKREWCLFCRCAK